MRATTRLFTIAVVLLFVSCGQTNEHITFDTNEGEEMKIIVDIMEQERLKKRIQIEEQGKTDSLNDDSGIK